MKNPGCTPGQAWPWNKNVTNWSNCKSSAHTLVKLWILNQFPSGNTETVNSDTKSELFNVSILILLIWLPFKEPTKNVSSTSLYLT